MEDEPVGPCKEVYFLSDIPQTWSSHGRYWKSWKHWRWILNSFKQYALLSNDKPCLLPKSWITGWISEKSRGSGNFMTTSHAHNIRYHCPYPIRLYLLYTLPKKWPGIPFPKYGIINGRWVARVYHRYRVRPIPHQVLCNLLLKAAGQ